MTRTKAAIHARHLDPALIKTGSKILRFLFNDMMWREMPLIDHVERAGIHYTQAQAYRAGRNIPNVMIVEAMLEAEGFQMETGEDFIAFRRVREGGKVDG